MFGVPMLDASLYLTQEVEAALLGQVSEVANQVCDSMFVAGATLLLENGHRLSGPGDVSGLSIIPINPEPQCKTRGTQGLTEDHPTGALAVAAEQNCRGI